MNLSRPVRIALVVVATAASVALTLSGLPSEVKGVADAVLTVAAALGIVPLHLDVVDAAPATPPAAPVAK
ncbi:MAG: hypothetical protein ACXVGB_00645 [Mycobacteriaceae bacterium]